MTTHRHRRPGRTDVLATLDLVADVRSVRPTTPARPGRRRPRRVT